MRNYIENSIRQLRDLKALISTTATVLAAGVEVVAVIQGLELIGAGAIAMSGVGIFGASIMVLLGVIAACEAYNTCDGIPPALKAGADIIFANQEGALAIEAFTTFYFAARLDLLPAASGVAVAVLSSATFLVLLGAKGVADALLDWGIKKNQDALGCCELTGCNDAICHQSALNCLNHWGGYYNSNPQVSMNCYII